jgi:hypothetical protein
MAPAAIRSTQPQAAEIVSNFWITPASGTEGPTIYCKTIFILNAPNIC